MRPVSKNSRILPAIALPMPSRPQQFRFRQRGQVLVAVAQPAHGAVVGARPERLRILIVENGQAPQLVELCDQFVHLQRRPHFPHIPQISMLTPP